MNADKLLAKQALPVALGISNAFIKRVIRPNHNRFDGGHRRYYFMLAPLTKCRLVNLHIGRLEMFHQSFVIKSFIIASEQTELMR